jgi:hypothetical protein
MANINNFKDKVDEDELARMTRELESSVRQTETVPAQKKSSFDFLKSPAAPHSENLAQITSHQEKRETVNDDISREEDEQDYSDRRETWMEDLALDISPDDDTATWVIEAEKEESQIRSMLIATRLTAKEEWALLFKDTQAHAQSVKAESNHPHTNKWTNEEANSQATGFNQTPGIDEVKTPRSEVERLTSFLNKAALSHLFEEGQKSITLLQQSTYDEIKRAAPLGMEYQYGGDSLYDSITEEEKLIASMKELRSALAPDLRAFDRTVVKTEETTPLTRKIEDFRSGRVSVENNLEAEAYTAEALRTVIDAQNASKPVDDSPSDVEGMSQSELEALQNEARSTFAPAVKRDARSQPAATEPSHEELNRAVPLHPSKVGINALLKDIEKSEMDPSKGIRDFYNKVYSEHGDKRLRDKESYLNLPITGDLQKARNGLSKFDELNGFNSSALDTLNDGVISAMRDLHKEEREKNPKDIELRKRHAAEEALFSFRESSEKLQDNTPQTVQAHKDSLREVLITHTQYAEQRWGRQLNAKDRPSVNEELEKYQLGLRAPKASAPTILQDVKQAQEIQKSKMQMKISRFR